MSIYQISSDNHQKDNFHNYIFDIDTHYYYDILTMNFISLKKNLSNP